jgi:acyl-CoA dehydrogenase
VVAPFENDPRQDAHGPHEELRRELVELARRAGLLTPHVSVALGGMGLSHIAKAVMFEICAVLRDVERSALRPG